MQQRRLAALAAILAVAALLGACQNGPRMTELEPGLSYEDSVVGTGDLVEKGDYIVAHYTGWFWEEGKRGKRFDSSHDRGEPLVLPIGSGMVIKGWDRGIPGMRVGGVRKLLLAPEVAYGEAGSPPHIPPSATLYFQVEIVEIPDIELEVLEEGTGAVAGPGDRLSVDYEGWVWVDGAKGDKFDSSLDRGRPYQLKLGARSVIPGWEMALDGLKEGTRARVIIPPALGYGKRGSGTIPPDATLCFEIHLVEIID